MLSREEWREGLLEAIKSAPENLYILQEYKKPAPPQAPGLLPQGRIQSMEGRVRLCPYYFVLGDQAPSRGGLPTFLSGRTKRSFTELRDAAHASRCEWRI